MKQSAMSIVLLFICVVAFGVWISVNPGDPNRWPYSAWADSPVPTSPLPTPTPVGYVVYLPLMFRTDINTVYLPYIEKGI